MVVLVINSRRSLLDHFANLFADVFLSLSRESAAGVVGVGP